MTQKTLPIIIGNWKMHGRLASNQLLLTALAGAALKEVSVAVAVPAVYLLQAVNLLQNTDIAVGAQDVSAQAQDGAYTGEVSAAMLRDVGARYVLIGHSERRQYFAEQNLLLSAKLFAALEAGLTPVLCIGETQQEQDAGCTEQVLATQLDVLRNQPCGITGIHVAYEPVWAIGTGKVATTGQIAAIHAYIKNWVLQNIGSAVSIRVLYGGSVKADNAEAVLSTADVDGALVGGASLDAAAFLSICQAAERIK